MSPIGTSRTSNRRHDVCFWGANADMGSTMGFKLRSGSHILTMTQWQPSRREPAKTKDELREMLAEAVRNTQPEQSVRRRPRETQSDVNLRAKGWRSPRLKKSRLKSRLLSQRAISSTSSFLRSSWFSSAFSLPPSSPLSDRYRRPGTPRCIRKARSMTAYSKIILATRGTPQTPPPVILMSGLIYGGCREARSASSRYRRCNCRRSCPRRPLLTAPTNRVRSPSPPNWRGERSRLSRPRQRQSHCSPPLYGKP